MGAHSVRLDTVRSRSGDRLLGRQDPQSRVDWRHRFAPKHLVFRYDNPAFNSSHESHRGN